MLGGKNNFTLALFVLCGLPLAHSYTAEIPDSPPYHWTQFVHVEGQPEPVPVEWVATPEGKFAHSIKIPNPVPKDSGYLKGMTSEKYFEHLCKTEAGEFIYKSVDNVEGFYFMRPPKRPTDDDLKDRYKLEAPEIERTFQLRRAQPEERGKIFINPPWAIYTFVEEPAPNIAQGSYVRVFGYKQNVSPMKTELVNDLKSRYGLIWRGLKRPYDREHAIAGSEWIVLDLKTKEILSVLRDYALSGRTPNTPQHIWWLNALNCPNSPAKNIHSNRFYVFIVKSLTPIAGIEK